MAEGHHFRNIHMQNILDENEELRRRINKLTEIQAYVELLVDKLEQSERKQKTYHNENQLLRQQVRELQIKFSQIEGMHGDQMRYVFGQHDQLVEEKNANISHLKSLCEKEQSRALIFQSDLKNQKHRELQMQKEYEDALTKYRLRNSELEKDITVFYQSLEQQKHNHSVTRESWISQGTQLKATCKDLTQRIKSLNIALQQSENQCHILNEKANSLNLSLQKSENERHIINDRCNSLNFALQTAENQCHMLNEYNQTLNINFTEKEADLNDHIIKMQNEIDLLRLELQKAKSDISSKDRSFSLVSQELEEQKVSNHHLRTDNETFITDNQRLIFLLQESDKENVFLREKQRQLQEYSTIQLERAKLQSLRLREENSVLNKNNSERQNYLSTKLLQLKETSNSKNHLEIQYSKAQNDISILTEEMSILQIQHHSYKLKADQLDISLKAHQDALQLAKKEIITWDQMCRKLQQENLQSTTKVHNLSRQLTNPRQINKDYREQIDKMLKNFHQEREEQNKRHWLQKQKLRQVFEYEVREKELQLMRRISWLQSELNRNKSLQILSERGLNLTPVKLKQ